MTRPTRSSSFSLRLALLAVLFSALIPTVSYLVSAARGERVIEICTSFGAKRIVVDAEGKTTGQPVDSKHGSHCNYCLPGQDAQLQAVHLAFEFSPPLVSMPAFMGMGDPTVIASIYWRLPPSQAPPSFS